MNQSFQRGAKSIPASAFVLTACALAASQAIAQDATLAAAAPAAAASAPQAAGNEVVITATRVRTTAQTTPVSLSVYKGEDLANAGVATVQNLQAIDPSISLTPANGTAYVAIRGVASQDVTEAGDPSVSIARDGFFTNRSYSVGTSFYDLERIEILKGPQGTLFGRNSSAGLINVISRKPEKENDGYVSFDLGTYGTRNLEGAVNRMLTDTLQVRFSGVSRKHDGYRNLTGVVQRGDDDNTTSGRLQVAMQPLAGLKALLTFQHDAVNNVGDVAKMQPLATVTPVGDARSFLAQASTGNKLTGSRVRWELNYDQLPGNWSVSYQGGVDRQHFQHHLDATDMAASNPYPASRWFVQDEKPTTWNHELRFVSPQDGPLRGQFGLFHFTEQNELHAGVFNVKMVNAGPGTFDYSNQYGIKFDYDMRAKSSAVYGQGTYQLDPAVSFDAGVRWTRENKDRVGSAFLTIGALADAHVPPFVTQANEQNGSTHFAKPTYLLGANWRLTRDNFLYAKYSTGFKSGGFNSNGSAAPVPYGPEEVTAIELGAKNRFLNRRLQWNFTAFMQDYGGYQASQATDVLAAGGVFNVGDARIKGFETDLGMDLGGGLRFDSSATYLSTRFADGIVIRDGAGASVDVSGKRLPNAPKGVLTAGVEQAFGLAGGQMKLKLFAKHSTAMYFSVPNTPDEFAPATTTANFALSYGNGDGTWNAVLYVDNLTDKVVIANARRNYVSHANPVQFGAPRTAGVRVRYNF